MDIADFSSALITAASEQELQQVVLTRLAATFGASGALLALVDNGRLRISTDAGIAMWEAGPMHGLPLDHPSPVPEAIRTGRPQFIAVSGTTSTAGRRGPNFRGSPGSAPTTPSPSHPSARPAISHSGRGW
jgi:hypothetical protein